MALRRRLGGGAQADVRQLRLDEPDDEDWALTLLVSRTTPTPGQFALLLDLCAEPAGLAALVPGGTVVPEGHSTPASIELAAAPDEPGGMTARVWPLGLEVWPQPLDESDYAALGTLLATAGLDGDVAADEPPYDGSTWPPRVAASESGSPGDEPAVRTGLAYEAGKAARPGDELAADEGELAADDELAAERPAPGSSAARC